MKSGIELIAIERQEQIEKHGFTDSRDKDYEKGELSDAAIYALSRNSDNWPVNWDEYWRNKIFYKTYKDRLIVAGALIAAEIDRLQNS